MGHNLGMVHDTGSCSGHNFVMEAIVSNVPADRFSNCSRDDMTAFFEGVPSFCDGSCLRVRAYGTSDRPACLENQPAAVWTNEPVCGDGFRDVGEDCDCGRADCTGLDDCCDGAICRLKPGATCSAGDGCCNTGTCQLAAPGSVCRGAAGDCDRTEKCVGDSPQCPADRHAPAGTRCVSVPGSSQNGVCHAGHCMSHAQQCLALRVAFPDVRGECALRSGSAGNDACEELFCGGASPHNCLVGFNMGEGRIRTQDGTPCGAESQCLGGRCRPTSVLARMGQDYFWATGPWSPCEDEVCTQSRFVSCRATSTKLEVAASRFTLALAGPKPAEVQTSPVKLVPGSWSTCSVTCGGGTMTRSFTCVRVSDDATVAAALCDGHVRPATSAACRTQSCELSVSYDVSDWSPCSAHCEGGTQARTATCRAPGGSVMPDGACANAEQVKPELERACNEHACPVWRAGAWATCSDECDGGHQMRAVTCSQKGATVDDSQCAYAVAGPKPPLARACGVSSCFSWHTSRWSECVVVSDDSTRQVSCRHRGVAVVPVNATTCTDPMPATTRSCRSVLGDAPARPCAQVLLAACLVVFTAVALWPSVKS